MMLLHFAISNPWHKGTFKSLYHKSWLFKNSKAIELQSTHYDYDFLEVMANLTFRQDHAGLELNLCIFGYSINFRFYDTRHWNYEKGAWETYDDDNTNS